MQFDENSWREQIKQKLNEIGRWLDQRRRQDLPYVAYGTVAGMTVWPLVATAVTTGQLAPVILTLYATAAGVGANLIANQIEAWKNRAKPPTEDEVTDWVQETVAGNAELRQALDTLIEKLDVLPQAEAALPAAEREWFRQALREEMAQLGNLTHFQAYAIGAGTTVQGKRNVTATHGSVAVGRDLHGDVVMHKTVQEMRDPSQMDAGELRAAYLTHLLDEHNRLLLGGIDPKAATADNDLALSAVYTALLTESVEQNEMERVLRERAAPDKEMRAKRLSALTQLNRHNRLVLLGDPGSGKSTFVNFVAVCLAGEALTHPQLNLDLLRQPLPPEDDESERHDEKKEPEPQPWDQGALLPVCIVLRDFAARGLPAPGQKATADHLWQYLESELKAASLLEYLPFLKKELLEKGGLFLFDGLDEVPTADQHRLHIKQVVEDVARVYGKCRILVTSRTYAYQKQDWRLSHFAETVLAPFSRGQIEQFVTRWYAHVGPRSRLKGEDAQGRAALLKQAIFNSRRLYELAERPLLLTLMASLHAWRGGSLPEKREELYADAVDLLLDLWEQQRIVRDTGGKVRVIQPSLEQWLRVNNRDKVRELLNRLAYEAHAGQAELVGTADIAEEKLVMGLLALSEDQSLQPRHLVEFLSNRAGLLLPRGVGVYTFPHRTFQEYLAACHLTQDAYYPAHVAELARTDPDRWREAALLAGAKAARGSAYALWALVTELCHQPPGEGGKADYWGAHLAGQFLVESADLTSLTPARQRQVDQARHWLAQALTRPTLPATERALAGRHLAQLGDTRPEVLDVDAMQFCYVPAGDFDMGEGEELHRQHCLDYPYWLARFPVTHAQYMAFVDAGGYGQEEWWAEAVAAGVWQDGAYTGWGDRRTQPRDWGRSFQLSNQPVVGVSWYEALAFSKWLMARWRKKGWLPASWQVTLPSEAEWEKAARGGLTIPARPLLAGIGDLAGADTEAIALKANPAAQRIYPWTGSDLTPELANYGDGEINQTSAVGCFAGTLSVYGCEEMIGNVFEWTRSLHKSYPYDPDDGREKLARGEYDWTVLRGGGWAWEAKYQRCGARNRSHPSNGYRSLGIRLALSPSDSGL
jgi:formylglycine-generating enzyme required for sulfatase activity